MTKRLKGHPPKPHAKAKAKAKAKAQPAPTTPRAKTPPKAKAAGGRFDRTPYALPVLDLGDAIALGTALLAARPGKAGAAVAEDVGRMSTALGRARALHRQHAGTVGDPVDARPFDVAMDRAWATFVRRVHDHLELPAAQGEGGAIMRRVYEIVQDLSILKMNYLAEFAQIGGRLDALKREGLLDDARALAGEAFVEDVLRCHAAYGEALGVGAEIAAAAAPLDRGEARLALIDAIAEYVYQVLALARPGRPESWALVTRALRPVLDAHARAALPEPAPRRPNPHPPVVRAESGAAPG
jgi:hypothetical protein